MATELSRSRVGASGVCHHPTILSALWASWYFSSMNFIKTNKILQLLSPESNSVIKPFLPCRNTQFSKLDHFNNLNCLHQKSTDILVCARAAFMKILQVSLNIFSQQYSFNQIISLFNSKKEFIWLFLESLCIFRSEAASVISQSGFQSCVTELKTIFRNFSVKHNNLAQVREFLPDIWQIRKAFLWSVLGHWITSDRKKVVITSSSILILTHSLYTINITSYLNFSLHIFLSVS